MKTRSTETFVCLALSLLLITPVYARGGGFGGGRGGFGGGGGFRSSGGFGGHSFDRSGAGFDSIGGRAVSGAGRSGWENRSSGWENRGGATGFENKGVWDSRSAGGWDNRAGYANSGFQNRAGNIATRPAEGGFGNIAGDRYNGNHPLQPANHPINQNDLHNQGQNIRNSFNNNQFNNQHVNQFNQNNYNFNHYGATGYGYGHGYGYGYGGYGAYGHGWWGYPGGWYAPGWGMATAYMATSFGTMAAFLGLAALGGGGGSSNTTVVTTPQPVSYDYGNNITYQGDTVYVNGQPSGSSQQYYQQAQQLAANAYSSPDPAQSQPPQQQQQPTEEWKPLGVFSLAEPGQNQSTMLFQLAINKDGIVRGNYCNQITNENSEIYGSLDKKTQRISWTVGTNPNTVFDTSLGNLMKDDSTILVHFSPSNTQQMAFIRMPPPQENGSPNAAPPPQKAS